MSRTPGAKGAPPIVWSVAGTDSGGGAGLAADLRSADAFDVHLVTIVAAVTAQNSCAVTRIEPVSDALFDAQWQAVASDLRPLAVKTGLLGSAAHVRAVARGIDRLREHAPVALVVDPVLGATTGAAFVDDDTLRAYRDELLPRATLVTPNRAEARRLLGLEPARAAGADGRGDARDPHDAHALPELASRLRAAGAKAVCITGGDARGESLALDWLDTPHAQGWLALPRVDTAHHHGTGCTFATAAASALARGFVEADAAVLAKMATTHALRRAYAAGMGSGPVRAGAGFESDPTLLPLMSWGEEPSFAASTGVAGRALGLYGIVDSAERIEQVLGAGLRTLQLRMKTPAPEPAGWRPQLSQAIARAGAACAAAGAELFVNDHWELAREHCCGGVHLGQEDLLALGERGRRELLASGLSLGISSHSLWELCRARSLGPRYVACGPVWPTLTKAMPWRAQGLDNLGWWCRMAGVPVVAIGGVLDDGKIRLAAARGADGVCVVRALDADLASRVPAMQRALRQGQGDAADVRSSRWPRPSLDNGLALMEPAAD